MVPNEENVILNPYSFSLNLQGPPFSKQGVQIYPSYPGPFSKDNNGNYVKISRNNSQNPFVNVAGYANGNSFTFSSPADVINYKSASMIYDSTGVGSVCCWHGDLNLQMVYTGYDNNLSQDVLGWNAGTASATNLPSLPGYGPNVIYAAPSDKTLTAVKLVNGMGQNGTGVYPIAVFAEYDSSLNVTTIKSIELSHVYRKVYGRSNTQIIPHNFVSILGKVSKIDGEGISGKNRAVLYIMASNKLYIYNAKAKMHNGNNDDWYFPNGYANLDGIYSTPDKITAFKLIKNQSLKNDVGKFLVGTDKGLIYGDFSSLPQTVDPNNIPAITPQVGCSYVVSPSGYPSLICQYYQSGSYMDLNAPNYKYVSVFGYGAGGGGGVSCLSHGGSSGGSGWKSYSLYIPNAVTNYYNVYVASGGQGNPSWYNGGGGSSAVHTSNTTLGLNGNLQIGGGGGGADCYITAPDDGGANGGSAGVAGSGGTDRIYFQGAGVNDANGYGGAGGGGSYIVPSTIKVPYQGGANNGGSANGYDEAGGNGGNGYELLIFTNVNGGAFTGESNDPLPSGPWIASCKVVSYDGLTLNASCQTEGPTWKSNQITVHPDGNCNNNNGNLGCAVD